MEFSNEPIEGLRKLVYRPCKKCENNIKILNKFCSNCGQVNYSNYQFLKTIIILKIAMVLIIPACVARFIIWMSQNFVGYGAAIGVPFIGFVLVIFSLGAIGALLVYAIIDIRELRIRKQLM